MSTPTPSRPDAESGLDVPPGLAGVRVVETAIGEVRGSEGLLSYRGLDATRLARERTFEEVAHLLLTGHLPGAAEHAAFAAELTSARELPEPVAEALPVIARASAGRPLEGVRSALSIAAPLLGAAPWQDQDPEAQRAVAARLIGVTPSLVAGLHRLARGLAPIAADPARGLANDYLRQLTGRDPDDTAAAALERYLSIVAEHGLNASTFAARLVTSTGADLGAAVTAAAGALSGPLHGGAPGRALEFLDAAHDIDDAERRAREAVARGDRIMGFGHRVYRTADPRARLLRETAEELGGQRVRFAHEVEERVVATLAELKPGRELHANVELYAAVVMERVGVPAELFTPTFTIGRMAGWCAHALEQAGTNRLIRPSAAYVGPSPGVAEHSDDLHAPA
ncbi:citrate synthase [Egibacter rhizosphaerae]|uniref:Citrate synthase n=1 Tax=Egibacter rhizosphaerae TaxID=1670831 RepID=A0A411YI99_9ACTN|nr:citrate synthase [Egibacter rhizosphaerae]QBI21014.1 citrate synthase [Egibacter rhizosphaerae]